MRFVHCYIRDTIQRFIIPRNQRNSCSKTLWLSVKRWTYHSFLSYHRQGRLMSNTDWWWMLFLASVLKGMQGHHLEMHYQPWRMLKFLFAQWTSLQVRRDREEMYNRIKTMFFYGSSIISLLQVLFFIIWLNQQGGKVKCILYSDWLHKWAS